MDCKTANIKISISSTYTFFICKYTDHQKPTTKLQQQNSKQQNLQQTKLEQLLREQQRKDKEIIA
jgi:ATP sulfurylase